MWSVHIACSGEGCEEELELLVAELDELAGISCDCGYGFVLLSVSEHELIAR